MGVPEPLDGNVHLLASYEAGTALA